MNLKTTKQPLESDLFSSLYDYIDVWPTEYKQHNDEWPTTSNQIQKAINNFV